MKTLTGHTLERPPFVLSLAGPRGAGGGPPWSNGAPKRSPLAAPSLPSRRRQRGDDREKMSCYELLA